MREALLMVERIKFGSRRRWVINNRDGVNKRSGERVGMCAKTRQCSTRGSHSVVTRAAYRDGEFLNFWIIDREKFTKGFLFAREFQSVFNWLSEWKPSNQQHSLFLSSLHWQKPTARHQFGLCQNCWWNLLACCNANETATAALTHESKCNAMSNEKQTVIHGEISETDDNIHCCGTETLFSFLCKQNQMHKNEPFQSHFWIASLSQTQQFLLSQFKQPMRMQTMAQHQPEKTSVQWFALFCCSHWWPMSLVLIQTNCAMTHSKMMLWKLFCETFADWFLAKQTLWCTTKHTFLVFSEHLFKMFQNSNFCQNHQKPKTHHKTNNFCQPQLVKFMQMQDSQCDLWDKVSHFSEPHFWMASAFLLQKSHWSKSTISLPSKNVWIFHGVTAFWNKWKQLLMTWLNLSHLFDFFICCFLKPRALLFKAVKYENLIMSHEGFGNRNFVNGMATTTTSRVFKSMASWNKVNVCVSSERPAVHGLGLASHLTAKIFQLERPLLF